MRGMQATTVIQNSYVGQTHTRCRSMKRGKNSPERDTRLNGDGRPKLVTGDEFTDRVRTHEEADQEEAAKEARGKAVKKYKVAVRNEEAGREPHGHQWEKENKISGLRDSWEKEWSRAKAEGRKIGWKKPRLADFELEKQKKKPTLKSFQKPDKSEHSEGPVDEAEDIADGCGDADGSEGVSMT